MKVAIRVTYDNNVTGYFVVHTGWRIDTATEQLIIDHGIPRKYIPLKNVHMFEIVEIDHHE